MDILRTTVPTKIVSTLSIYLLLSALCPVGQGFYFQPVLAGDNGSVVRRDSGPGAGLLSNLDRLVVAQPTWQHYLQRAEAIMDYSPATPAEKSRRAVSDCLTSLRLQQSPLALRLLTRAYLLGGSNNYKMAAASALKYLEATAGTPGALQLVAFTSLLVGDLDATRAALARFIDGEVKNGHAEDRKLALSSLPAENSAEMKAYLVGAFEPATPERKAQRQLVAALIEFCQKQYRLVEMLSANFAKSGDKQAPPLYRDLALFLSGSAELLDRRYEPARAHLMDLLRQQPAPAEAYLLLDDLYFATDKREEGLKLLADRAASSPRARALAKALDEYGKPEEALKILQSLSNSKTSRLDDHSAVRSDVLFANALLERARLESKLNQNSAALADLHACIEQNPKAGQPYFVRAQIYAQQKQWTPAAKDLTKAIDNGFSLIKATRARAACYSSLGQAELAKKDMNVAAVYLLIGQ